MPIEMDVEEVEEEEEEGFEEAEEIALRFPQDLVKLLIAAEAGNVDHLRQALGGRSFVLFSYIYVGVFVHVCMNVRLWVCSCF